MPNGRIGVRRRCWEPDRNMSKSSFRLGVHLASHYASLFDAAKISIQPAVNGPRPWPELGVARIGKGDGEGDLDFEILMPTEEGCVPERLVSRARSVLSHVVEMDDAARIAHDADPDPIDLDEVLAYVVIRDAYVVLHYFATTMNTEWDVYFTPNGQGGWDYRGLQLP
jgi:hypothetical protein